MGNREKTDVEPYFSRALRLVEAKVLRELAAEEHSSLIASSSIRENFVDIEVKKAGNMSSIFEAYDAEFGSISQEINKNINELKRNSASESSPAFIKQLDALFSQSASLIKQMEVELRSHDPATRKVLSEKVGQYKKSNASLKSDYERVKEQAQRSTLVGDKSAEQRQRLLNANDK